MSQNQLFLKMPYSLPYINVTRQFAFLLYVIGMWRLVTFIWVMLLLLTGSLPAHAQQLSFIRDAELEHTLKMMGEPIFKQAGLVPDNVNIFIVQSDDVNAFVAGGQNIFIFTGLLKQMTEPDMLLGVIAHETGHIAGGHLARGTEQLKNAQIGSVIGFVLGVAAAAAGAPDAGMAVMSGGGHLITRNFLSFTRSNEQSADQAALGYLDALDISAYGMVKTFELLKRKERSYLGKIDPYAITHPLSSDRIAHARNHAQNSTIPADQYPKKFEEPYARLVAKLYAFTELPSKTLVKYPKSDVSVAGRMARAVAYHKQANTKLALEEMQSLLTERPKDGFLHELHGQLLFESSRIEEARKAYETAYRLRPDEPLIATMLAEVYLAENEVPKTEKAINLLEKATSSEPTNSHAFRLLATGYGRIGNLGLSHMALAEEAALQYDADEVERNVEQALKSLPQNSPSRLRAEDLKRAAKEIREEEK